MAKWIYNNTGSTKTYVGQNIAASAYYQIQDSELVYWANDGQLLTDIVSTDAIVSKSDNSADHLAASDGINYLKDINPQVTVTEQPAFAAKKTPDGKSLFVRDKGMSFALSSGANNDLQCNIDYNAMKFNGIEIVGAEIGDSVNLKVLDTPTGTISTVPNYMLNQFGFSVNVAKDYYHRQSKYDADLIKDMKIAIDYDSVSAKTIYVNYILHEVK